MRISQAFAMLLLSASALPNTAASQAMQTVAPLRNEPSDLRGTYAGFSLCADCEAMAIRLELTPIAGTDGGTYTMKRFYVAAPRRTAAGVKLGRGDASQGKWTFTATDGHAGNGKLCLLAAQSKPDCYGVTQGRELRPMLDEGVPPAPVVQTLVKMLRLADGHEYPVLPADAAAR